MGEEKRMSYPILTPEIWDETRKLITGERSSIRHKWIKAKDENANDVLLCWDIPGWVLSTGGAVMVCWPDEPGSQSTRSFSVADTLRGAEALEILAHNHMREQYLEHKLSIYQKLVTGLSNMEHTRPGAPKIGKFQDTKTGFSWQVEYQKEGDEKMHYLLLSQGTVVDLSACPDVKLFHQLFGG